MNNQAREAIFFAQVKNTRELETAIKIVRRSIHEGLRTSNEAHIRVQTKVLGQVFCAWAEANFLKVLHTPHGFTLPELGEVRKKWSQNGLAEGWGKAVQFGLKKIPAQKSGFSPNARQELERAIDDYVRQPSLLRNKIAHGQWSLALNSKNDAINPEVTGMLAQMTIITVDRWYGGHRHLASIIESLIESPERTFSRDFWPQLTALKAFAKDAQAWTIETRSQAIKAKYERYKNVQKA